MTKGDAMQMAEALPDQRESARRMAHLLAFLAELPTWRGRPWGEVVTARTLGLDDAASLVAVAAALDYVQVWTQGAGGLADPIANQFTTLPPLDDRRAWAALELATIMIDRFDPLDGVPGGASILAA